MNEQLDSRAEQSVESPAAADNYQATKKFIDQVAGRVPYKEARLPEKSIAPESVLAVACTIDGLTAGIDAALYVRQSRLGVTGKLDLIQAESGEKAAVTFVYHNDPEESGEFPQQKSYLQHQIPVGVELPSYIELLSVALARGRDFSFTMHHIEL